jgi:hypothetical protein
MPRIRTIKPEFWTDEKLSLLDPLTRLVYLGLISLADDYGRLIDNIKSLDGALFPHTDESSRDSLETLTKLSRILRYRSKAGQQLIQIVNWGNHQKVNHRGKEILPAPTKEDWLQPVAGQRPIPEPRKTRKKSSRDSQEAGERDSCTIPPTNDHLPTSWPADAALVWKAVAPIPIPRVGRELKTVVDEFGWPDTRLGLEAYIELNRGKPRKLSWFVDDSVRWIGIGKMPAIDPETREPTERGRLALRVS